MRNEIRNEILNQVKSATLIMVRNSFCIAQNFPSLVNHEIVWEGFKDISFALRNEKYDVIYKECLLSRAFNLVMIDGAIIQMMYRFNKNDIEGHRLAFYPNPNIERYQDNPEDYEELYYGMELFTDIIDENILCSPLRFDYDIKDSLHMDCDHPKSHLTIGNYLNCRIPVASPITPNRFLRFILRNFYYQKYLKELSDKNFDCKLKFNSSITSNESKLIHLNFV